MARTRGQARHAARHQRFPPAATGPARDATAAAQGAARTRQVEAEREGPAHRHRLPGPRQGPGASPLRTTTSASSSAAQHAHCRQEHAGPVHRHHRKLQPARGEVSCRSFRRRDRQRDARHRLQPAVPIKHVAVRRDRDVTFEITLQPEIKAGEPYFAASPPGSTSPQLRPLENDGLARRQRPPRRRRGARQGADPRRRRRGADGRKEGNDSFFSSTRLSSVPGSSYDVVYGDELGGGDRGQGPRAADLQQYPTILLLNVRELTAKQVANLENYVRRGRRRRLLPRSAGGRRALQQARSTRTARASSRSARGEVLPAQGRGGAEGGVHRPSSCCCATISSPARTRRFPCSARSSGRRSCATS